MFRLPGRSQSMTNLSSRSNHPRRCPKIANPPKSHRNRGSGNYFRLALACAAYVALWIINGSLRLPLSWLPIANVVATIIFVGLPIVIIAVASRVSWKPWVALAAAVGFLACVVLLRGGGLWLDSVVQIARFGWPAGLGFLISSLIRDRNLLLPIAIVLATVDILAVFAPSGSVNRGLSSPAIRPIFDVMAYQVPTAGSARPIAQMGPADPLFVAMFLFAINKFKLAFRTTVLWLIPALIGYLAIVVFAGDRTFLGFSLAALPALVPVSIVVVTVNAKYFKPSKQEMAMTAAVAVVCLALVAWLLVTPRTR
jgi:hypothetical protein